MKDLNSETSIIIVDGLPKINPSPVIGQICTCETDARNKCNCFKKPCECDNDDHSFKCVCFKSEPCLCYSDEIETTCTCTESKVCLCHSDNKPRPICTCDQTNPCFCHSNDMSSVCNCNIDENNQEIIPTTNQELAHNHKECTCKEERHYTKEPVSDECQCFPNKVCDCDYPGDCKCFHMCECTKPCICDYIKDKINKPDLNNKSQCICLNKNLDDEVDRRENKLKKVKVSKQGYRWCNEVDDHHTFFDYGYGRHDKILPDNNIIEKVKILGLYNEKVEENVNITKENKASEYKKKTKPSLDCCSAVGGIDY